MELAEGDICLTPLVEQGLDEMSQQLVGGAWCELMHRSADVVLSNTNAVFEFLGHESCIYLACIQKKEAGAGNDKSVRHTPLGIIYIASAQLPNTLNIGVALHDEARGEGYAARAVHLAVGWAFAELHCHRVQAQVVRYGDASTDDALRLFASVGFACEGTQRRALFCAPPTEGTGGVGDRATNGEWRDVSLFAVLDTDWALRAGGPAPRAVKTLWDDMFMRHQRESEDVVALEDRADQRRRAREERRKEAEEQRKKNGWVGDARGNWGLPQAEQLLEQREGETMADTLWRQMQAEKAARDAAAGRPPPNPQPVPAEQPPPAVQTPPARGSKSKGRRGRGRGRGGAGAGSRGGAPPAPGNGGPSAPHAASGGQTRSWAAAARTSLPEDQTAQAASGKKARRGGRGGARGASIPAQRRATDAAPDDTADDAAEGLSRISLADAVAPSTSAGSAASTFEN